MSTVSSRLRFASHAAPGIERAHVDLIAIHEHDGFHANREVAEPCQFRRIHGRSARRLTRQDAGRERDTAEQEST